MTIPKALKLNLINKTTKSYTLRSMYNIFLNNIKDNDLYNKTSYNLFKSIIIDYYKYIEDELIENGNDVRLPSSLGTLSIIKKKFNYWDGKGCSIDYKATKENNKLTYYINEHSNGYKFRLYWSKQRCNIANGMKYMMVLSRTNKRRLAQIIKNKEQDYLEL
jgi:hypothetical protein